MSSHSLVAFHSWVTICSKRKRFSRHTGLKLKTNTSQYMSLNKKTTRYQQWRQLATKHYKMFDKTQTVPSLTDILIFPYSTNRTRNSRNGVCNWKPTGLVNYTSNRTGLNVDRSQLATSSSQNYEHLTYMAKWQTSTYTTVHNTCIWWWQYEAECWQKHQQKCNN